MEYNYDDKRRCEIIGMEYPPKYFGGCESFKGLTLEALNLLLDEGFIDPEEYQNCSPTVEQFKEFMEIYPEVTLHGYIVSPERHDYRVSVEGLEYCGDVSKEMLEMFVDRYRFADDFICDDEYLYCWFD